MAKIKSEVNYVVPFITLVFLFFIVGFLTTANGQFQGPLKAAFLGNAGELKNTFATLISFSWFMAYPLTGGIGSTMVNKYGYKNTLIRALLLMIVGLGIFYLSSFVYEKFPQSVVHISTAIIPVGYFIFLLGSFVVGTSATFMQVVLNPYLTACNVKGTQPVQRLNIGGSSNSIGTTVAPFFVTGIVFGGLSMEKIQVSQLMMPFLSLMAVIAIVTLVLSRISLPEIEETKTIKGEKLDKNIWSFSHLTLGIIAIFFYVGAEVAIGANINLFAISLGGSFATSAAIMATLYWGGMLLGRLISSSINSITPQVQLAVTSFAATLFIIVAVAFNNPWLLVAIGLFHSVMWGSIFTLSVSKLGKYTSKASGTFMIGVLGGAFIPLIQGGLADAYGWRWTWVLIVVCELYILFYALNGYKIKKTENLK
jgi:MFS transporter, FHS family, L-fucose permease